ncbi:MAG: 2-amino-4-hydroxy-6-hydroxymethyldihydropteridine diphosphokinase [Muribaculaceae bacterium]|nr:2-amino-4-hydroxy-6-hydroxymethyldihydropteridine diphosphokinase [Muribaculaceae bacterium]
MIAHVNIGSNQGNRKANIARAIDLLADVGEVLKVSDTVSSAPWGFESDLEFLNVGVNLETECSPRELLFRLQEIERKISPDGEHRNSAGDYQDREIDLDLIAYGDEVLETDNLTLPHPRMHLRRFVLQPMAELLPQWRHPLNGLSCEEMLGVIQ